MGSTRKKVLPQPAGINETDLRYQPSSLKTCPKCRVHTMEFHQYFEVWQCVCGHSTKG